MKQKLIILCGPTGVGKTQLSLRLAQALEGEVIMADSQSILKGFDIGTAKPSLKEQQEIPHHLMDVAEFGERFDAARYSRLAHRILNEIFSRGKQPIVCGGTGLYIKAMLYGLMEAPSRDEEFRKKIQERIQQEGIVALHEELRQIDSKRASQIHRNDAVRIIRALELYSLTGLPPSELSASHRFQEPFFESLKIGLSLPREELYERIDRRVVQMIQEGWTEEVRALLKRGYDLTQTKTQTIGYATLARHLQGKLSLEEAISSIRQETRQLAKRQMTWFRADREIRWLHPEQFEAILEKCKQFL